MSYGYDSGGILSKSVSDIEDVARGLLVRLQGQRVTGQEKSRPILFVAHTLGGVVIKKVLISVLSLAKNQSDISIDDGCCPRTLDEKQRPAR